MALDKEDQHLIIHLGKRIQTALSPRIWRDLPEPERQRFVVQCGEFDLDAPQLVRVDVVGDDADDGVGYEAGMWATREVGNLCHGDTPYTEQSKNNW